MFIMITPTAADEMASSETVGYDEEECLVVKAGWCTGNFAKEGFVK